MASAPLDYDGCRRRSPASWVSLAQVAVPLHGIPVAGHQVEAAYSHPPKRLTSENDPELLQSVVGRVDLGTLAPGSDSVRRNMSYSMVALVYICTLPFLVGGIVAAQPVERIIAWMTAPACCARCGGSLARSGPKKLILSTSSAADKAKDVEVFGVDVDQAVFFVIKRPPRPGRCRDTIAQHFFRC